MSEAKTPRIDPRFDPRFQRGYVPDAAAGAAEGSVIAEAPDAPVALTAPTAGQVAAAPMGSPATSDPASIPGGLAAVEADGRAAETLAHVARAEGERLQGGETSARMNARQPSVPDDEPGLAALFETPSPERPSSIAPWFIAGWGVAVVASVVGVALWWSSIVSQDFYSGPSNESDRWLQLLGWMVAPSLVEAGLLGLVAMLVWTGVRHARGYEEPS
ncbi:hypothetical protein [Agromyces bauzanensis]|uniref:Uncharacterized protein n=1 Tax=Agromyces bauzanensis TaxID=1308924 RepID=A0A917PQ16_9MICO|nr:hypothetical protein [Agromyces bauzanensis]GGJ86829.1 hypothetical protein GCM10011372_26550 [Agromyces bauzanensis]